MNRKQLTYFVFLISTFILTACSTPSRLAEPASSFEDAKKSGMNSSDIGSDAKASLSNDKLALNQQILQSAAQQKGLPTDADYLLGTGDIIEITVFQVDELNTKARVNAKGTIILPLVGTIAVAGRSVEDVETELVANLSKDFLQNPQVSVFIEEYRSQQITVMGAVQNPNVYNVRKSRSIFELLSMAGGITEKASDKVRVRLNRVDETGKLKNVNLVLSMQEMLKGSDEAHSLRLIGGDSILVPDAGVVFVEGAVKKPGAYKLEGQVNVLKAIALAGGVPWEAKSEGVKVVREINGRPVSVEVDVEAIKVQKGDDILLQDGDVVVVGYDTTKRAFSGFFKTFGSIFGYSLN